MDGKAKPDAGKRIPRSTEPPRYLITYRGTSQIQTTAAEAMRELRSVADRTGIPGVDYSPTLRIFDDVAYYPSRTDTLSSQLQVSAHDSPTPPIKHHYVRMEYTVDSDRLAPDFIPFCGPDAQQHRSVDGLYDVVVSDHEGDPTRKDVLLVAHARMG